VSLTPPAGTSLLQVQSGPDVQGKYSPINFNPWVAPLHAYKSRKQQAGKNCIEEAANHQAFASQSSSWCIQVADTDVSSSLLMLTQFESKSFIAAGLAHSRCPYDSVLLGISIEELQHQLHRLFKGLCCFHATGASAVWVAESGALQQLICCCQV
jgi:hypothetical protein